MDPCFLKTIFTHNPFKVKVGPGAVVVAGGQDETFTVRDTVVEYSNIDQALYSNIHSNIDQAQYSNIHSNISQVQYLKY